MAKVVEFGPDGKLISKTLNSGVNESTVRAALSTAAGPVSVNTQKITDLQPGVNPSDAVAMSQLGAAGNLLIISTTRSAGGNVYNDFNLLMAARPSIPGPVTIYVETEGTPVTIPGVAYDMFETSFEGPITIQGTIASQEQFMAGVAGGWLKISDGAVFNDLKSSKGIFYQSESTSYIFDNTIKTTPYFADAVIVDAETCMFQLDNDTGSGGTGTSPLFPSNKIVVAALSGGCAFSKTNYTSTTDCVVQFPAPKTVGTLPYTTSGIIVCPDTVIPGENTLNGLGGGVGSVALVHVAIQAISSLFVYPQLNFNPLGGTDTNKGSINVTLTTEFMTVLQSYNTTAIQNVPVSVIGPTAAGYVLTSITGPSGLIWQGEPSSGGGAVSGTWPIGVTGPIGSQVVSIDPNPVFQSVTVEDNGIFWMDSVALNNGTYDYDWIQSGLGSFVIVSLAGGIIALPQGNVLAAPNAAGTESWSVAGISFAGYHATIFFPTSYFATPADLIAWCTLHLLVTPTVDFGFETVWTPNGRANYTWVPPTETIISGFPNPPSFRYVVTAYAQINSTAATFNVPLVVRTVYDAGMFSTAGSTEEIVYNALDNKLYQCVQNGTPAVWAQLETSTVAYNIGATAAVGSPIGLAEQDGGTYAFLTDISQPDIGTGVTPYALGLLVGISGSSAPYTAYIAKFGTLLVADAVFDVAPTAANIGDPIFVSATPGNLALVPPTGPNQWIDPVGSIEAHGGGHSTIDIKIATPTWIGSDAIVVPLGSVLDITKVKATSLINVDLTATGAYTIDSVTINDGELFAALNQTVTPTEIGVYVCHTGAVPTRYNGWAANLHAACGEIVVDQGSTYGGWCFICTSQSALGDLVGVDTLTFRRFGMNSVNIPPTDGQVSVFNGTSQLWVPTTQAASVPDPGGGSVGQVVTLTSLSPRTWGMGTSGSLSTYYVPDLLGAWTDLGVVSPLKQAASIIRVGSTYYGFGGWTPGDVPVKTVYTAHASDPGTWTLTTATLPVAMWSPFISVIRNAGVDTIWFTGAAPYQTVIMSIPASNPLGTWTTSTNVLPHPRGGTHMVVSPDRLIIPYGEHSGGQNSVASASVTDPTTWTESGPGYLPTGNCWGLTAFLRGNTVYTIGGGAGYTGSPYYCQYILAVNATTGRPVGLDGGWTEPISPIPNLAAQDVVWELDNQFVIPIPGTTDISCFDPSTLAQRYYHQCLPTTVNGAESQFWIGPVETDGCMYMRAQNGGITTEGHIWKSSRIRVTGPTQVPGSVAPIQCWTDNGQSVMLTTTAQRGFPSQWCNHAYAI